VPALALFGTSVALGFVTWGIVAARYLWPALRNQPRAEALRPQLLLHSFRFIGLAFLVPGVVSPDLPEAYARPAAYGDLIAAVLALLALAALRSRPGIALVWVFNVWGTADLLYAFYQGLAVGLEPGWLGATYFSICLARLFRSCTVFTTVAVAEKDRVFRRFLGTIVSQEWSIPA
jgi:hypothetical protein